MNSRPTSQATTQTLRSRLSPAAVPEIPGCCVSVYNEHIDLGTHKFRCQCRKLFTPAGGMALFDHDIPSLHILELSQSFLESGTVGLVEFDRIRRQKADAPDLTRFLGLGGERRGEETTDRRTEECAPIHYSIT